MHLLEALFLLLMFRKRSTSYVEKKKIRQAATRNYYQLISLNSLIACTGKQVAFSSVNFGNILLFVAFRKSFLIALKIFKMCFSIMFCSSYPCIDINKTNNLPPSNIILALAKFIQVSKLNYSIQVPRISLGIRQELT